jgi:hypothetical protein
MNRKLVARVLPSILAAFGVVQANAAECFVSDRTFPDCVKRFDSARGSCPGDDASGLAGFAVGSCDPATKFVEAFKTRGTGSAFVSGVTSSGAAISNCTVVVSSPVEGASQHHKTTSGGCSAAIRWRIRIFT